MRKRSWHDTCCFEGMNVSPLGLLFVMSLTAACSSAVFDSADSGSPGSDVGAGANKPTDGGEGTCVAEEASLFATFSVVTTGWPQEVDEWGEEFRRIDARCYVDSVTSAAGPTWTASLLCSEGEQVDVPLALVFEAVPSDFGADLRVGDAVALDYSWRGEGHHTFGGEWFAVHDGSETDLLLLGIADEGVGGPDTSLELGIDDSVCPSPCGDGDGFDCQQPHRVALTIDDVEGSRSSVVSGTRAEIDRLGTRYDVIVSAAVDYDCLNCWGSYHIVIAAKP